MLDVRYSTKLKKDFKICVKRHYKMEQLQQIIDILRIPDSLPPQNSDHNLTGNHIMEFPKNEELQIFSNHKAIHGKNIVDIEKCPDFSCNRQHNVIQ